MKIVEYRVEGRCPLCRATVTLVDDSDPLPAHRPPGQPRGALCPADAAPVSVKRVAERSTIAKSPAHGKKQRGSQKKRGDAKLSRQERRKQKDAVAAARYQRQFRRGSGIDGEATDSVRTTSGGLPTLGR